MNNYFCSRLERLSVDVRCGVHPWEKFEQRPNRLEISLEMFNYSRQSGARSSAVIDYDRMRNYINSLADRPHVDYLETLAEDILAEAFKDPLVEACRVSIMKSLIFAEAQGTGIEIFRNRD